MARSFLHSARLEPARWRRALNWAQHQALVDQKGLDPEVSCLPDRQTKLQALEDWNKGLDSGPQPVENCSMYVIARTNGVLETFRWGLQDRGIEIPKIKRNQPDDEQSHGVRPATKNRAKGLEFLAVEIVAVGTGIFPLKIARDQPLDEAAWEKFRGNEPRLLFVVATRARKKLLVTCSGRPSELPEILIER